MGCGPPWAAIVVLVPAKLLYVTLFASPSWQSETSGELPVQVSVSLHSGNVLGSPVSATSLERTDLSSGA